MSDTGKFTENCRKKMIGHNLLRDREVDFSHAYKHCLNLPILPLIKLDGGIYGDFRKNC